MQFKYPELLWALFLLLIPIIIHLFQLRKFRKTPFTNVKLLKKVVAQSRRSQLLKKWLLLLSRLLLLAAIVLAFAQPYLADKEALIDKETVVYIDDSFSMQAKTEGGTLLETAIQGFIKSVPKDQPLSLFTNEHVFKNRTLKELQNELLTLPYSSRQMNLNEVYLMAETHFSKSPNSTKRLVLISDFQKKMAALEADSTDTFQKHLVQLLPEKATNVSIDTAYLSSTKPSTIELTAILSGQGAMENIPVSLYNGADLIAKTAAVFDKNQKASVLFSLPAQQPVNGRIEISDAGLAYDNQLFFNINEKEKIKVLTIGSASDDFLEKIYTEDEFNYTAASLNTLNYSTFETQNLVVLNQLESVPNALQNALRSFVNDGGSLVIIPALLADLTTYNALLAQFFTSSYTTAFSQESNITTISFSHPIYRDVFEQQVTNFQYPKVSSYFGIRTTAPPILSLQGGAPFLVGENGVYIFTASLDKANSNIQNSPLIVPTLYNMGTTSLQLPHLYYTIGSTARIDVPMSVAKDKILHVKQADYEFIPQQQSFAQKTTLTFIEDPKTDGIYSIVEDNKVIKNISFNYYRDESNLAYLKVSDLAATSRNNNVSQLFEAMENINKVTELWKWFVILAVLFILAEIFIQKFLK